MERHLFYYETSLGTLGIADDGSALTRIFFAGEPAERGGRLRESALLREAADAVAQYAAGELRTFNLPLTLRGTVFQEAVWTALQRIPYGETRSYGQLAAALGKPGAARAVGMANNRNPVAIIVPCHRVIGADGSLVGYAGGTDIKKRLLEIEQRALKKNPS